ncbi:MAG: radical SAM protein, partial [Deltaproteobacteria bacterium]|nr:radical SAM protein [Deltaproteobacteria bacterium]
RRLVNALDGQDRLNTIPGLSYKHDGKWVHNEPAPLCDLSRLKLPIRDRRRLTSGYHLMFKRIEVLEISRGCTRDCNFCSIRNMYGRSYRTYPVERIIADLDDIYFNKKTRFVFIADDNMVLNPKWVMEVCEAVIRRNYGHLELAVQADCNAIAKNEAMVAKMAQAGFRVIFLGIENVSERNLQMMHKADVLKTSRQAIDHCHRNGMMVIGGLIFGLPDDDEEAIRRNYQYLRDLEVDAPYCQMLSPFPGTALREELSMEGLLTNSDQYTRYNGLWANVKTRHMEADELQYAFWYHRQVTLGWWTPSPFIRKRGKVWVSIWTHAAKPLMKFFVDRKLSKQGWEGRYRQYIERLDRMNRFKDLKPYERRRQEPLSESRETGRP